MKRIDWDLIVAVLGFCIFATLITWGGHEWTEWAQDRDEVAAREAAEAHYYHAEGWGCPTPITERCERNDEVFEVVETLRCGQRHQGWHAVRVSLRGDEIAMICCLVDGGEAETCEPG